MIKVLRIINRFNLGGPTYNATYLSAYLPNEFETKLCGGAHEKHEGDSLFIPEACGLKPIIIESLQRSVNFKNDKKALKEIRELIREYKPDIVHTHASKAGAIGRLAAYKENVPVIVHTFHGHVFHSYFGKLKTWFYKMAERRLAKKTDAIIAISEIQKNELVNIYKIAGKDKFHVIPLGFDLNKFQYNKEEKRNEFRTNYNILPTDVAIGIIGRLTSIKNHDLFFETLKIVGKITSKNIRVFVIGDGELMTDLKHKAFLIEKQTSIKVEFTSWITDIAQILPGLDIVALTSFNEGTPVSLIEAQAASVPAISTNVGGVADVLVDGKTGFVVNSFDPALYAEKLMILIEDEEIRKNMSQNGWIHVKDKFHYERLCKDVAKLYHNLLEKKKK